VTGSGVPMPSEPWRDQVRQGLVGLGWSAKDADQAIDSVAGEAGEMPDVAALLRAALRTLSRT
jgi:Holliday junction DNA helicase RuvA